MSGDIGAAGALRIGTMVNASATPPAAEIARLAPHGFETFQPFFWQDTGGVDLAELGERCLDAAADAGARIEAIGMFCNPLLPGPAGEAALRCWEDCIDNASRFGASIVGGFTGRLPDVSIPDCLSRFERVWSVLARRAADRGVRIAFENCAMGGDWTTGDWNIAHGPAAWERMFDAVPSEALGLEWEPCHQMLCLIDPLPQIRKWSDRIFHVHGKDATIRHDVIAEHGVFGAETFALMRTPGFGDSDWTRIISELHLAGYRGCIDIEGWHDPVFKDALELAGQLGALRYLKRCAGAEPPLPPAPPHAGARAPFPPAEETTS